MRRSTNGGEDGFTVIEMMIATTVMMVVALMAFYGIATMSSVSTQGQARAQANTVVSSALDQIRLEVTSANIIYDPAAEGSNPGKNPDGSSIGAGFSLRIYTQNNGILTCMQWRLLDTGALQVRSWSDDWQVNGVVKTWTTLVSGITNKTGTAPFVLDNGSNYGGSTSSRLLDLDVLVGGSSIPTPVEVKASIAGRDAEYYPQNTGDCSPVPS